MIVATQLALSCDTSWDSERGDREEVFIIADKAEKTFFKMRKAIFVRKAVIVPQADAIFSLYKKQTLFLAIPRTNTFFHEKTQSTKHDPRVNWSAPYNLSQYNLTLSLEKQVNIHTFCILTTLNFNYVVICSMLCRGANCKLLK